MASWGEFEQADPELAAEVKAIFTARKHHTLATLRGDGSPRVSGIEVEFRDGQVGIGLMGGSVKATDLARDPRLSIHALSDDAPDHKTASPEEQLAWKGDAKIAGTAVPIELGDDAPPDAGGARIELTEVVMTKLGGNPPAYLEIRSWHPGRGTTRTERA